MSAPRKYTPTQQRLLAILQDGKPHPKEELIAVLNDDWSWSSLRFHLSILRKLIRPLGVDIVYIGEPGKKAYQQVITMAPYDE